MSPAEWESLCDGCARCCLVKLEDEETGESRLHRCGLHPPRRQELPLPGLREPPGQGGGLRPADARGRAALHWLPPTCAYRLLAEGEDLYWWHPLVSGDPESVHLAGISVQDRVAGPEEDFTVPELIRTSSIGRRTKAHPGRTSVATGAVS